MALPQEARRLISQAIAHTAFAISCSIPEGGVIRIADQIERELDEAGYVVVTRDEVRTMRGDRADEVDDQ